MTKKYGIENKGSVMGRVYRALKQARRWVSTDELAEMTGCHYVSTQLSDIRKALDKACIREELQHSNEGKRHFYRIVRY